MKKITILFILLTTFIGFSQSDVKVSITDNQTLYTLGQTIVYNVTVTNIGSSSASNVVVNCPLPSGINQLTWTGNNASSVLYGPMNNTIVSLIPGQIVTYLVSIEVPLSFTGDLVMTVTANSSTTADSNTANNTSIDTDFPENTQIADLSLVNTDGNSVYIPGTTSTYTLTLTNNGPNDATNVIVSNPIPSGIVNFSWSGSNGSSGTNVGLNDVIPLLLDGQTITYTINVDVPSTFTGDLTSFANVTSNTIDPIPSCFQCVDVNTKQNVADIVVTNTDGQPDYFLGGVNVYTLTVTNNGPDSAYGVNVFNAIPSGITDFTWVGSNGTSGTNVDLFDTIAVLLNGQSVIYTITLQIPLTFTGNLISSTNVTTTSFDPDTTCANCTDTDVLNTIGEADLIITNTDNQGSYILGGTNIYTVTVTNNGPQNASNIQVQNLIPAGITDFSWSGDNGSSGTNIDLIDTIPVLLNGETVTYTIILQVPLSFTGNLTSTASASSNVLDPDTTCANCSDTDVLTVTGADIVIVNTDNQANYILGGTNVYTVTVTNNGPQNAPNVQVQNLIPAGITNFSWIGDNGSNGTNVDLNDTIALLTVNQTVTYTITLQIPATFTGDLINETTVSSSTADPNPICLQCTDIDTLLPQVADLYISLTDNTTIYTPGQINTYTLDVINNGPISASDVLVTGGVPLNIDPALVTWTASNGTSGTGLINQTIPNLANGASVTYTISVYVPLSFNSNNPLVNNVSVSSSTPDPTPSCSNCTDVDTVLLLSDLVTIKTNNQTQYLAGEPTTYSITITNQGPNDAQNVVVTDNAPSGTNNFVWTNSYGNSGSGSLSDTLPQLLVGETVVYLVTVVVNEDFDTLNLTNTVSVTSSNTDPSPSCISCTDIDTPRSKFITVNTTTYPLQNLVEDVLIDSDCAQISNLTSSSNCGIGYFHRNNSDFGFKEGVVLRSGNAAFTQGTYSGNNLSSVCSDNGDAELLAISQANGNSGTINDVTFVKFNFTPLTNNFSFNFIFASNEYGTFQCGFSDVFAFILTDLTTGISTNLAVIPGTTIPVSVTNIRDNAYNAGCPSVNEEYFDVYNPNVMPPNPTLMNMEGYTVQMTAFADVIPNNPYSIKLVIGDYNDTAYDSAVFIEGGSFNVGTANLSYPVGVGSQFEDMTIENGFAPCPGEIRVLDVGPALDPTSFSFEWTIDGNVIASETGPTFEVDAPGNYCVTVNNINGGSCIQRDCVLVEYQADFIINDSPDDLLSCNNNFDLSQNTATILNGLDSNTYDLVFFDSLAAALDPDGVGIPSLVTTSAPVTTFYAAVYDIATNCKKIAEFNAVVSACQATPPQDMIVCDDISNDGVEAFDLTTQDAAVLAGLPASDFTITYHLSQAGADADNDLATPATAYVGGPNQIIYVRMESNNNPAQYSTTTFNLIVNPLPTAAIGTSTICEGTTATVTFSGTPGATVDYFDNDGVLQTIVLNASGTATITTPVLTSNATYALDNVTSVEGCTRAVNGTATVIVNPLPVVSISTTTPSICAGNSATIEFTGTPDATVTYTIDGATNTIDLDGSGVASVLANTTSTYCLVSVASDTTPICTQSFTECVTISVIPLPTASITGATICLGDTAVVTFTGTPNASVNYTIDGAPQTAVTLSPTGTATVSATVAGTFCLVDVTTSTTPACTELVTECADVIVLPEPPVNAIADISVCDDDNDGFATFDLTGVIAQANGGDTSLIVTIHETQADADFPANALTASEIASYNTINFNQVLYIRVENTGGCYSVTTVNLIVNPRPELNQNVSDYELCDVNNSPDGVEVFDLTNAALTADITNGVTGITLTYYLSLADAQSGNNPIPTPSAHSNVLSPNQQTIWVVGENAAGCRDITSFDLIVNPLPVITPLADMNGCSDGINLTQAPFNLTLNSPLVTGGAPGFIVSYHTNQVDADADVNEITTTPYIGTDGETIIVRVENATTGCYSTTTLQLNVTQGPVANTPNPLTYCDPNNDGIGEFNLQDALNDISGGPTPTGVTVTFHETPEDAQLGTNPITDVPYNNIVPNQQTIYVSVSYALTGCANYTELQLIVNPTPELIAPLEPLQECDDEVADGFTQFDLTAIESVVLGGIDPTTVNITYHLDAAAADAGTGAITNVLNYTNTSNPQTLYIRVEFIATGCYSVESFDLVVNPLPIMPVPEDITMSLCDVNNSGDQIECFDLDSQIPLIINGQTNMIVTFHFSQADAIAGVSPLTSPYCNTSNAQSIFVRLENGATGCFDTVIMDLRVEPLPVLVTPDPVEECGANQDGFAIFDLTALEIDMLNGATGITLSYYETFDDANNQVNPIVDTTAYQNIDPFNQIIYVVAVDNITGCSSITMIELVAHPAPIMPTLDDLVLCDTNYDGYAYFDLTVQNPIITAANTISPLDIRYYTTALDATNGTAAIVNMANFYGGPNQQTIWVVVTDPATGCSATTTFDLIINLPVDVRGQNNRLTLCDESLPNDQFTEFDLTIMNAQILNGNPGTVTYYLTVAGAMNQTASEEITTPTAFTNTIAAVQTLGVVVTSADGCISITTLTIRVEPLPTPNEGPYDALEVCDNDQTNIGTELFDLTVNQTTIQDGYPGLTFTYYASQEDYDNGIAIPTPTAYEGPTSTIIIAVQNNRVDFFGENCAVLVYQPIQVNPLPEVVDTTYVICDDDTDGSATFTLSDYNVQLLGATQLPADFTVTYYDTQANAQAGTSVGLLPDVYTNGTNPELIYPRVVNNATGCVNALAEVTLVVKLRAIANPISQATLDEFTVCDYYNDNDGIAEFDLTIVETELLGSQTTPPITITYHLTPQDQATGDNAIANPSAYVNTTSPGTQIIYIRVERANDDPLDTTAECYDVAEITLNVELLAEPVITSDTGFNIICVDFNTGNLISGLTLDSGIPAGSGYTYEWTYAGQVVGTDATYTITDASPGVYTVVVTSTSAQACVSEEVTFEVIQSGPAANIQSFVSGSFEEIQTITITNDGYGTYEYQLDGEGPWQSSPIFTNVPAGEHFVLVRDVTNPDYACDEMMIEDVSIINYPHFFTPNGDGINDTWNITGLDSQSNAKIYIFDRYGKLLKQISASGDGWNGTLNSQPLPATDYWFTVDYYEITIDGTLVPKQFKAHFTLKR